MTDEARRALIPDAHRIVFVRHAQSRVERERDASEWGLTEAGEAAARRLTALALFERVDGFYAGPEPKMLATLAPVAATYGRAVQPESDFSETRAGGWLDGGAFEATVERLFTAPGEAPALGWESGAEAARRVATGIERLCGRHVPVVTPGHALPGTFAIATGGRALVSYLAQLFGWSGREAFEQWRALRMPDLAVVDLVAEKSPRLTIPFGALLV
jgi:broad specificity phosphatase PhoE